MVFFSTTTILPQHHLKLNVTSTLLNTYSYPVQACANIVPINENTYNTLHNKTSNALSSSNYEYLWFTNESIPITFFESNFVLQLCVCVCVSVCVCMHARVYLCMHAPPKNKQTNINTYIPGTYIHTYTHTYIHTHTHAHTHTHTHTHTHIHTHTLLQHLICTLKAVWLQLRLRVDWCMMPKCLIQQIVAQFCSMTDFISYEGQ